MEKAEVGWVREEKRRRKKIGEEKESEEEEDAGARKGRKVAKQCVFPMLCGPGGSKSRLAKAAGAEPSGQLSDQKLHAAVARANVENTSAWEHFEVEMLNAVVARSTFRSQNLQQNTPCSEHYWKLRCWKSACRCGAKHISKSKSWKQTTLYHFWKLTCRKMWRETNLEVKSVKKTDGLGPLLDVEMSKKWTLTLTPTLALTLQLHLQIQLQLQALKDTTTTTRHTLQLQLPLQLQLRLQLHDTTLIYATLATPH